MEQRERETRLLITEADRRLIDAQALKRCGGDIALFFHQQALLAGEFCIYSQGEDHWRRWQLCKRLPQYKKAEASVAEGWRKFVENAIGIPAHQVARRKLMRPTARIIEHTKYLSEEQQRDSHSINQAILLSGLSRATDEGQAAKALRNRKGVIAASAAWGDVQFFKRIGTLLNSLPRSPASLLKFAYPLAMLNHWLTSFLWLMPERSAAIFLATGFDTPLRKDPIRRFRAAKHEGYQLCSHQPSLVNHIESNGEVVLTVTGRRLLFRR